jgi:hypothetical protein
LDAQEGPEALRAALGAARQEAATLRGVFEAVHEALAQALTRLEVLEAQVGALGTNPSAPSRTFPTAGAAGTPPSPAPAPRPGAEWKLPGWTPAVDGSVVTGETLRARREAMGISQAAVAHAAHCSRGLVAEVERGKRRSAQTLAHLDAVLDRMAQQARRN